MLSDQLNYSIIYSNRRTISIGINQDGSVIVRAPRFMSKKDINAIVNQKIDWIEKKQKQMIERKSQNNRKVRTYEANSTMPYLGDEYPLHFEEDCSIKTTSVSFHDDIFYIRYHKYDKNEIRQAFRVWYINKAKEIYLDRIRYYFTIIQEPFGTVRIKEQKSCYGSCSSKRNLNFNWKCILAPLNVLDYVIVHEMCHLKELNHSKRFWSEVEKVMPDYKLQRQWLKEHSLDI